ncbi:1-aminocyclopropane-1-carboxylate deaminase/D-cysteine desulfhydrase, partial [Aegicerativicinus sediminis]
QISGNKYRKLKYNLETASKQWKNTLVTFGGAFSNHVAAVAFAGKFNGFKTIGVIRGEELEAQNLNHTLQLAVDAGMQLKFITRSEYRLKSSDLFISKLRDEFGDFYLIPEGGTNELAIKGCEEILDDSTNRFTHICCSVGTGGTVAGIVNCSKPRQQVLGFSSLKGDFLRDDIAKFAQATNWKLIQDYHFGGYGKINTELIRFINTFKRETDIPLDPIYTGKMFFGIYDLISKGYFPEGSNILGIHTGGLQGIVGMNEVLKKKNLPLLEV